MPRTLCIVNPTAARGRAKHRVRAAGEIALTERPGHAADLAERAGLGGFDTVIACGGDGTVHEVVNGLMRLPAERRPAMGVMPLGGGNDFAFALSAFSDPPPFQGGEKVIDLARITDDRGRSAYFANSAGLLFDAAVNARSHRLRLPGFSRYFVATTQSFLLDFRPTRVRLTLDGTATERDLLMLTLGNGPREGGGFYCTPDARIDDGRLDYLAVAPMSRPRVLALLPQVMRGTHAARRGVTLGRFRTLRLEADASIPIHLDGELWAGRDAAVRAVTVETVAASLRAFLAPESPVSG